MVKAVLLLNFIRCFPHLVLFLFHGKRFIIAKDCERWLEVLGKKYSIITGFIYLLAFHKEFRNLFYYRLGPIKHFLNLICPKMSTLYIATPVIGEGLFIQHGFATIIAAKSIGKNCWINQQVTIGFSNSTDCPEILDNVVIYAGAKVLGKVLLGNNCVVGANAVVIKDVPANCVVGGVPARVIKRTDIVLDSHGF